jgi:hypothetical protein
MAGHKKHHKVSAKAHVKKASHKKGGRRKSHSSKMKIKA